MCRVGGVTVSAGSYRCPASLRPDAHAARTWSAPTGWTEPSPLRIAPARGHLGRHPAAYGTSAAAGPGRGAHPDGVAGGGVAVQVLGAGLLRPALMLIDECRGSAGNRGRNESENAQRVTKVRLRVGWGSDRCSVAAAAVCSGGAEQTGLPASPNRRERAAHRFAVIGDAWNRSAARRMGQTLLHDTPCQTQTPGLGEGCVAVRHEGISGRWCKTPGRKALAHFKTD